jgi:hypothetical protein
MGECKQDIDRYKGPWLRKQQNFPPKFRSIIHINLRITKLQWQLTQVSGNQEEHTSLQKNGHLATSRIVSTSDHTNTTRGEEHTTLNYVDRWTHTNFSTFHAIQILTVIVKNWCKLFTIMQFFINKYSLNYTCWTLIAWEGICTILTRACCQCHVQKKYCRG